MAAAVQRGPVVLLAGMLDRAGPWRMSLDGLAPDGFALESALAGACQDGRCGAADPAFGTGRCLMRCERDVRWVIVGAGVLGSLYAARLASVGADVRIVARGARADELERDGIILVDESSGTRMIERIPVVRALDASVAADVALVLVRRNQLPSVLPALATAAIPSIVFMTNNAAGAEWLVRAVGRERVLLGFPGAGGAREGGVVRARLVSSLVQPTTIGELHGATTTRLVAIRDGLVSAGFPVALEARMEAWLRTHAAVVFPVADAIYAAGGSTRALSRRPRLVRCMLEAIRDNLRILREIGSPITPPRYRLLLVMPPGLLVPMVAAGLRTRRAELVLARHANAARDEMAAIHDDLEGLRRRSGEATPAAARLARRAMGGPDGSTPGRP